MKFTAIALVATASAIRLRGDDEVCVTAAEADKTFDLIDLNKSGKIDGGELTAALMAYSLSHHYNPTRKDWAWVAKEAFLTAGRDRKMDKAEFHEFAAKFARKFHIDGCGEAKAE